MVQSALVAVLLLAASAACGGRYLPHLLEAPRPIVERWSDDELVIRWDAAPKRAPIPVYIGTSPESIDRKHPFEMTGTQLRIDDLEPATRYFFELAPEGEEPLLVTERLLPLEGAHNFRDLGGYATSDGRHVRWGMLYRSDDLAELTRDDLEYVSRLHINLVCDFRSSAEREQEPSRLPEQDPPEVANLEIADEQFDPDRIGSMIRGRRVAGVDFGQMLIRGNRAFVSEFSPQFAAMFERLSDPDNLPALVHCTAGKDRTGFAAAMVLLALGVPKETVLDDYMLTNVYTANQIEQTLSLLRVYLLFQTPRDAIRPLLSVRRDYLVAAFDEIDERYGSVDAYLRDGLGLSDGERERFREMLLY